MVEKKFYERSEFWFSAAAWAVGVFLLIFGAIKGNDSLVTLGVGLLGGGAGVYTLSRGAANFGQRADAAKAGGLAKLAEGAGALLPFVLESMRTSPGTAGGSTSEPASPPPPPLAPPSSRPR